MRRRDRLLTVAANAQSTPDLVSTLSGYSATQIVGQTAYATVTIRNVGRATAASTPARLVMSRDSVITTSDTPLSAWSVPSLLPGRYYTSRRAYRVPSVTGRCYLGSIADYLRRVRETSETNNTRAVPVNCVASRPDLVVDYVRPLRSSIIAGSYVDADVRVRNVGRATAASSTVGLFLSTDTTISTTDSYIGATSTGTLAASRYVLRRVRVRAPYCVQAGRCYLGAIADVSGRVAELSEANNTRAAAVTCDAYGGSGRILEYAPRYGQSSTASATATIGTRPVTLNMCVTSPRTPRYFYVLAWSGSSSFRFDALSQLGLELLNGPIMPNWFGQLDARGSTTRPALRLPRLSGIRRFGVYTHLMMITPAFRYVGLGNTRLYTTIGS